MLFRSRSESACVVQYATEKCIAICRESDTALILVLLLLRVNRCGVSIANEERCVSPVHELGLGVLRYHRLHECPRDRVGTGSSAPQDGPSPSRRWPTARREPVDLLKSNQIIPAAARRDSPITVPAGALIRPGSTRGAGGPRLTRRSSPRRRPIVGSPWHESVGTC